MLRVHQIESADAAERYYSRGDYYGQELVGEWGGKAAKLLGLEGQVGWQAFVDLCNNRQPETGDRLTAHSRDDRTVGYDFNFNAPKGVSLLYGTTGDAAILDAFRSAVKETMDGIEAEMKTRVRKGRKNEDRVVGNLVSAEFVHFTSRPVDGKPPDPNLHAHIVVMNAVHDPVENAWKAGYFRDLKRDAPYFEALFHNRLAGKLRDFGYAVERRGKDWDLAAIPRPLVEKFSQRKEQIENLAKELGIVDPEAKAKLGATSRAHKADTLDIEDLRKIWLARLSGQEDKLLEDAIAKRMPLQAVRRDAADKAVQHAALHLFERSSVVPYRQLLAHALRNGPGEVTLASIERAAKKSGVIVERIDGREMATLPEVVQEERKIIAFAKETRGTRSRLGKRSRAFVREWLAKGQKAAVNHALSSTDQVVLVEGRAGVGKTKLTEEIVDGIKENGGSVVMVAPSAQASRGVLREAGFEEADTLQRLLVDPNMQEAARGNVIIVDEAGLVGTPTMRRLFDVAKHVDARVILVGDRNQHHAVERGSPFELLAEKAKLPVARVDEIRRQSDAYREAVKLFSDRKTSEGFDRLDKLGWVKEVKPKELYTKAAQAFVNALEQTRGDALAVSPTHAEIDRFTMAIRQELTDAGKLGETRTFDVWRPTYLTEAERRDTQSYAPGMLVQFHKAAPGFKAGARMVLSDPDKAPTGAADRFGVYQPARLQLAVGDRVRLTAGGKSLEGHRLNNGALYGIAGFTAGGDIRLDNGWTVGKEWGHLTHGWVTTSHSAQSRTVRRAVVVQSELSLPASRADQIYVSASRAKEKTEVFTDSKADLKEAIQREDKRISATDLANHRRSRRANLLRHVLHLRRFPALAFRPRVPEPARELELTYERA